MSIQQYPSSPSPSVAFPSMERGVASLSLSTPPASSPNGVPRSPDGSPLRVPMPRSGSRAYKSPSTTPSRQGPPSRTMAVLMRSAAKVHRLAIESRIIDAGFDILAERSEHWYTPEDDDFLAEFLARDGASALHKWVPRLTNGSIYVLVLERDNAAKAWLDLLGSEDQGHRDGDDEDEDDDDGGIITNFGADGLPIVRNGLRKTYGADAFYGSANDAAAEAQISICFPELSRHGNGGDDAVEHSDDYMLTGRTGSPTEEMQRARRVLRDSDASLNARTSKLSTTSSKLSSERSNSDAASHNEFRARPVPSTTRRASIQPRLSKAAALRMGVELPEAPRRRDSDSGPSRQHEGPVGISGLPRADVPIPASLRPPTVAPRLNKVAAARTQQPHEGGTAAAAATTPRERKAVDYSNTPGHKRNSVIVVPSTAPPAVAPRQTRASMGRLSMAAMGTSSPSPSPGGASSAYDTGSVRRDDAGRPAARRASSVTSLGSSSTGTGAGERERKPVDYTNTPGHKRRSLNFHIPALAAPVVAPRVNRASLARTGSGSGTSASTPGGANPDGRPSSVLSNVDGGGKPAAPRTDPAELYANTPGHRRKSMTFNLASLQAPTIVPRLNAAAEARMSVGGGAKDGAARPGSSLGSSRPASRTGGAGTGPHQDGAAPRLVRPRTAGGTMGRGGGAAPPPPSSFKTPAVK